MTQPTETPPAEGSTEMVRHEHSNDANSGPVAGNRTPMVVAFVALGLLLLLIVLAIVSGLIEISR
ncbi:MAG TPA: hypothetical protein VF519_16545 [Mycobacteriales bacterium]|jgi:hypothetical protein